MLDSSIVLGIDPGIAITGYGLCKEHPDGSIETLMYGVIETKPKDPVEVRLLILYEQIKAIILLHQPQQAAVEKLFFQKNVKTAMVVGQARGVVLLALAEAGMPVSEYTPLEIKQSISGYGGATKNQVQEMVRMLLTLDDIPRPDDAADALAVAICHLHSRRMSDLLKG